MKRKDTSPLKNPLTKRPLIVPQVPYPPPPAKVLGPGLTAPYIPNFHSNRNTHLSTTTVHLLKLPHPAAEPAPSPVIMALVKSDSNSTLTFYNPLTNKPLPHFPTNLDISKHDSTALAVLVYSTLPLHKLTVFPAPQLADSNYDKCHLFGLFNGGEFWGCPPRSRDWRKLPCGDLFDDVAVFNGRVCVLDRLGKVFEINDIGFYQFTLGKTLVKTPFCVEVGGDVGWRKRLVVDGNVLYVVVRIEVEMFKVFRKERDGWVETKRYDGDQVLIIGRDCCFFMDVKDKYKDRIVFSEGAFLRYGKCGWFFESEDDTAVFRLREGTFRQHFDDWGLPDWIFCKPVQDEGLASSSKYEKDEDTQSCVNIESDPDTQAEEDGKMQYDSNSQEEEDEDIQTADTVMVSLSATEKEITRTLLSMNGGNDATEQGTPVKNIVHSVPTVCTSSTTMSHGTVGTTTKFEGFDIKSDLVPTMQKIWQRYGNIAKRSTIRNREIVARALETLATMVRILEDNSAMSLIDSQADYLISTLSDLRSMCFQVAWLIPSVEKAVQLHRDKPLLDSLINLNQLHSKVSERRAILLDECAKLGTEENKLKKEIAMLSARISLHGKVGFNEPLGSGLT